MKKNTTSKLKMLLIFGILLVFSIISCQTAVVVIEKPKIVTIPDNVTEQELIKLLLEQLNYSQAYQKRLIYQILSVNGYYVTVIDLNKTN